MVIFCTNQCEEIILVRFLYQGNTRSQGWGIEASKAMGFASWNHRKLCWTCFLTLNAYYLPCLLPGTVPVCACVDSLDKNAFNLLDSNCKTWRSTRSKQLSPCFLETKSQRYIGFYVRWADPKVRIVQATKVLASLYRLNLKCHICGHMSQFELIPTLSKLWRCHTKDDSEGSIVLLTDVINFYKPLTCCHYTLHVVILHTWFKMI